MEFLDYLNAKLQLLAAEEKQLRKDIKAQGAVYVIQNLVVELTEIKTKKDFLRELINTHKWVGTKEFERDVRSIIYEAEDLNEINK